jgi:ribosomal protein L7/L12
MDKDSFTEEQLNDITSAIIGGNKIEAIKVYRKATGRGLREAKEAVEEITDSLSKDHPEIKASNSKTGCFPVIIIGVCVLGYSIFEFNII